MGKFIKRATNCLLKISKVFISPTAGVCILLVISFLIGETMPEAIEISKQRLVPIYSVDRADNKIALTIDAAWGNEYTDEIIRILDRYGISITFFTVDFWAKEYPEDIKKLKLHGHEIGNHSLTHPDMAGLSKEKITEELLTTWQTQQQYAGSSAVRLFRAPYGSYSDNLIRTANELGFQCIQWDVDSIDWKDGVTADEVIERVLTKTKSGSIILMHNNSKVITQVLPAVIEGLTAKGYSFTTVSRLIYNDNFTIDSNGVQHSAK